MKLSPLQISLLLAGAAFAALIAGAVVGISGRVAYLVLIAPMVATLATAAVCRSLIGSLKVANPKFGSFVGVLAAILTMFAILTVQLELERAWVIDELTGVQGLGDTALQAQVDAWLDERTGHAPRWSAPLALRAHNGVRLMGDTTLNLGFGLNLAILLLEILAAAFIGWRLVRARAAEPFCVHCQNWYARRIVASGALGVAPSAQAELKNRRFHRLGRRLAPGAIKNPVLLHGRFCDTCTKGQVYFELEVRAVGGRARIVHAEEADHGALEAILDSQALRRM